MKKASGVVKRSKMTFMIIPSESLSLLVFQLVCFFETTLLWKNLQQRPDKSGLAYQYFLYETLWQVFVHCCVVNCANFQTIDCKMT